MRKPIAYLAGPLGFSQAGSSFHNSVMIPLVAGLGFDVRDPWTLTPAEVIAPVQALPYGEKKKRALAQLNLTIGGNNEQAIRESDIIIAVLDGPDVESGTSGEVGFGYGLGKTCIGYRSDFRLTSENEGGIVCLQVEYFIRMSGGTIVRDMESLKMELEKWKIQFLSSSS